MKLKKLVLITLSTLLTTTLILESTTSALTRFIIPEGNYTVGDYVVVNNESYTESQDIGTLKNVKENKLEKYSEEVDGIYQIDANMKELPDEIGDYKDINFNLQVTDPIIYNVGDAKEFHVVDARTNVFSKITANLLYSGTSCDIWVNDSKITPEIAKSIGEEYDNKITPIITNNFSNPSDIDQNGKVNILCYDIQDGFSGTGGYVAGYFYSVDLIPQSQLPQGYYSNESEMLYIDTYPTMYRSQTSTVDTKAALGTMAHESQHLVNYSRNVIIENGSKMPLWMDEGLAESANHIYSNSALTSRISYYNSSVDITNGHSLTQWNRANSLPNYSLSYLFFQYLKLQAEQGNTIFKEIIENPQNDTKAIDDVIQKYISKEKTTNTFTTDFRMALLLNNKVGLHGFKGDDGFSRINKKVLSAKPTSLSLQPGGAVVVIGTENKINYIPGDKGTSIKYLGVQDAYDKGDLNRDGLVSPYDLTLVAKRYNTTVTDVDWYLDPVRDGVFDIYDIVETSKKIEPGDIDPPTVIAEWEVDKDYKYMDKVSYKGLTYLCILSHKSASTWAPDTTTTLWRQIKS